MKKILAVFLSVVLIAALFCVATNAEADPDTWLCVEETNYSTGWWIHPASNPTVDYWDILVTFTSPNAFDGFTMACFASTGDTPAVLKVALLDEDDEELESQEITVDYDHNNATLGFISVYFDNAYAAGTYTIQLVFLDGAHFVLAQGDYTDLDVEVTGSCMAQGDDPTSGMIAARAPAIWLTGAEAPAEEESSEESVEESSDEEPVEESSDEEPVEESSDEEPVEESSEDEQGGEPTERQFGELDPDKLNIVIDGGLGRYEAKAGEEVDVKIELKGVTTLSSIKVTLTYDEKLSVAKKGNGKEKVDFSGMVVQYPDDATVMSANNNYPDDHKLILNWQALDDEINADSVFATITFIVAEDAEAGEFLPITAEVNANDVFNYDHDNNDDMVNVEFHVIDGGVDVIGEEPVEESSEEPVEESSEEPVEESSEEPVEESSEEPVEESSEEPAEESSEDEQSDEPGSQGGGDDNPSNPQTADAAIIAVAAVAAVALAGAVIGKKALKK